MRLGTIAERLGRNQYELDANSHISLDQAAAKAAGVGRLLESICPAGVYSVGEDGVIGVLWAACLECGACLALAPSGVLTWHYPSGGAGVVYRQG
ncbi:MAG: 4Fe-4S dicluster domain-containing protein [Bifidobacteriaceae bacterium]|jgi:ferredoxin like protein|nr:4Fe-4S dicluster domain-containing protein [Bifidobacteriaceae bacterium]